MEKPITAESATRPRKFATVGGDLIGHLLKTPRESIPRGKRILLPFENEDVRGGAFAHRRP